MTSPINVFQDQFGPIPLRELDENFEACGSFTQDGSGAVARTGLSKMRDIVCAFDYMTAAQVADVKARTATLNVAAAITAAATAVGSGGAVYAPEGTYRHDTGLSFANVEIYGDGEGTIFKPAAAVATAMTFNNSADPLTGFMYPSGLQDAMIDGSNTSGKTGVLLGTTVTTGNYRLKGVTIANFGGTGGRGLDIREAVWTAVENCQIASNQKGVYIGGTGSNPTTTSFKSCYIRANLEEGVYIVSAYQTSWRDCIFEANRKEGVKIITNAQNAYLNRFDSCWFEDNWFSSASRPNVYDVTIDGSAGGGVAGAQFINCFHQISGATEQAVQLTKALFTYFEMGDYRNQAGAIKCTDADSQIVYGPYSVNLGDPATVIDNAAGSNVLIPQNIANVWTGYAPTLTPSGGMTFAGTAFSVARYLRVGKTVFLTVTFTTTVGGVPSSSFTMTYPSTETNPLGDNQYGTAYTIADVGGANAESIAYCKLESAGLFVSNPNSTNWAAGTLKVGFTVTYETD